MRNRDVGTTIDINPGIFAPLDNNNIVDLDPTMPIRVDSWSQRCRNMFVRYNLVIAGYDDLAGGRVVAVAVREGQGGEPREGQSGAQCLLDHWSDFFYQFFEYFIN